MDIFEPREMTEALLESKSPKMWLRDRYFSNVKTHATSKVDIMIMEGSRKLAPYVSPRSEGVVMDKYAKKAETYEPPLLKPKDYTSAQDILKSVSTGDTIYNSESPEVRAGKQLNEDLLRMDEAIDRAEEVQARQALFDGKIVVKGKGVDDEVDFQFSAAQKPVLTGTALWTHADATPLEDIQTWKKIPGKAGGAVPTDIVMGADAFDAFMAHDSVKEAFDNRRIVEGQIDFEELAPGVTYVGRLSRAGLDIFTYDDYYFDDVADDDVPMVPVDKVLLCTPNADFRRHYGVIPEMPPIEAQRYVKSEEKFDPAAREVIIQSAPLCVPHQKNSIVVGKVV
jgi:hypothetical protein